MQVSELKTKYNFNLDDDTLKYLSNRTISRFKVVEVPIGRVHRYLDGAVFSLNKTEPWKLLNHINDRAERENYEQYCVRAKIDNSSRSLEHYISLIDDFDEYSFERNPILVDQNYCVIDGQHRACIILKQRGPKYVVKLLMIHFDDLKYFGLGQKFRNTIYYVKKALGMDV